MFDIIKGKNFRPLMVLLSGTFVGAFVNFLLQVILARNLSTEGFGSFSSSLALVNIISPLAGFGVAGFWLNVYGKENYKANRWIPASVKVVISSSLILFFLLNIWAWFGPHDISDSLVYSVLSFYLFGQASIELICAKFQIEGDSKSLASVQVMPYVVRLVGVGGVLYLFGITKIYASIVFAFSSVLFVIYLLCQIMVLREKEESLASGDCGFISVLKGAWPHAGASLFYLVYFQSNLVIIKYILGGHEAGIYGAAFLIIAAIYLIPNVIYMKFFIPKYQYWAHHDAGELVRHHKAGRLYMLFIGILISLLIILMSKFLIEIVFGQGYERSVPVLVALSLAIPLRFMSSATGAVLSTANRATGKAGALALASLLNIVIASFLIISFGILGAAASMVIVELLILLFFSYLNTKRPSCR